VSREWGRARRPERSLPVQRRRVTAAAIGLLAMVLGVIGLAELLRHPEVVGTPPVDFEVSDPRDPLDCPEPRPREGMPRDDDPVERIAVAARSVQSGDLLDCPQSFDGDAVVLRGEVVGAIVGRGHRVWIQVNDDEYAGVVGPLPAHRYYQGGNSGIGVHLQVAFAEQIAVVGGPGRRGDTVEVRGIFNRVEPRTGEVAVIRAHTFEVLQTGEAIEQPILRDRQVVAYVVLLLALGTVLAARRVERRRHG
jgi:hypothetical protein